MSYRPSSHSHPHRDDGGRNSAADEPPMSRLFIICNKNNTEEDFRSAFERFGAIEEIWVVRDKHSGENKGKHLTQKIQFYILHLHEIKYNSI